EELIYEFHDPRLCLHLLRGGLGILRRERLSLATLEADVDLGGPLSRELDEGRILYDVGEHSLPLALRGSRVSPELLEVRRHREEPFADRVVEDELILLSRTLPSLSCLGQHPQLVVPVSLECIGDEAITRID